MLSNEILLLKIIHSKGRISLLRDRGLSHSQIALLIKKGEDEGNIIITDEDIRLTSCGLEVLEKNISKIAPKRNQQWVLSQDHLYRKPISFDVIVLPKSKKM